MAKKLPKEQADDVRPDEPAIAPESWASFTIVEGTEEAPPESKPEAPESKPEVLLAPAEWARVKGHTNPTDPRVRGITNFKAWIFEAAKHHAGWGSRVALNKPMTEAEYDEVVSSALNIACTGQ